MRAGMWFFCLSVSVYSQDSVRFEQPGEKYPTGAVILRADGRSSESSFRLIVSVGEDTTLPEVLGITSANAGQVLFTPRFSFLPGVSYRVRLFGHSGLVTDTLVGYSDAQRTVPPLQVVPTTELWPENILRFYVLFSTPMSLQNPYEFLALRNDSGQIVENAFVEFPQGLWDGNRQRLTVLFHPGRIKRGVGPNLAQGLPLQQGRRYELAVLPGWKTQNGQSIDTNAIKCVISGPAVREAVRPQKWTISNVRAGTQDGLNVTFDRPLDYGLLPECLRLDYEGTEWDGTVNVSTSGESWKFAPAKPWQVGRYSLLIDDRLEDLAGNSVTRLFDRSVSDTLIAPKTVLFLNVQ